VLAEGAWVPVVLLVIAGAMAWSQLAPSQGNFLGFVTLPNFWWQLGDVALLVAVTLLCGWIQGLLNWYPPEIDLEPATAAHNHAHH
jgi:hypothetical protein